MTCRTLLLGLALLPLLRGPAPAAAAEPVKVGMLLSYSGIYANIGEEITNALELALLEAGGAVAGRPIQVIRADTEVKPNVALSKARELVGSDKVDFLVGPVSSSESAALRDFVVGSRTPLLLPNAAANVILGQKCSLFINRTSYAEVQYTHPMAQWLYDHGVRTVYTLAPDYIGPKATMGFFKEAFERAGGKVVRAEFTPFGRTTDFAPYLARIKAERPDALFVLYAGSEGSNFVKQANDFGLRDQMRVTGPGWAVSPLLLPSEGDAALGFVAITNYAPSIDTPENKAFQAAYQARFGRTASEFAAQGYDTGRFIVEALKATGGRTDDKEALVRALRAARFTGPRGPISIDPATNSVVQNMYVVEVVKGSPDPELRILDTIRDVPSMPDGCVHPEG